MSNISIFKRTIYLLFAFLFVFSNTKNLNRIGEVYSSKSKSTESFLESKSISSTLKAYDFNQSNQIEEEFVFEIEPESEIDIEFEFLNFNKDFNFFSCKEHVFKVKSSYQKKYFSITNIPFYELYCNWKFHLL